MFKKLVLAFGFVVSLSAYAQPTPIKVALIESMSGPFANTGEAVFLNLIWATERVNARGGVKLPDGARPLLIERYDSKGQNEEALSALRAAIDGGVTVIAQGNSSALSGGQRRLRSHADANGD